MPVSIAGPRRCVLTASSSGFLPKMEWRAAEGAGSRGFVLTMPTHGSHVLRMKPDPATAETNIHLRARVRDRDLIDQAAELAGTNRSQFMLASALKEAKAVLLDQTTIMADATAFRKILDWMDAPPGLEQEAGVRRLMAVRPPWVRG